MSFEPEFNQATLLYMPDTVENKEREREEE